MAPGTKICKICGKEYEYCYTVRDGGLFRWQDVACCKEHGQEYFRQILEARKAAEEGVKEVKEDPKPEEEIEIDDDEYEEDEDFDPEDDDLDDEDD